MSAVRVKFGEVVSNLNETVRQGEEHSLTRVVGLEHIEPQDPDLRRWDELSDLPDGTSFSRVFRQGQVLFGKRRAYQRKVAVAPFDGICSSDILVFAPANKKLHPDFLLFIVQSEGFFSHALQTSSGSLSPRTRWQDLATYEFELPSIEEQQRIVELLSGVDAHAEALRNQLHVAKETRKAVLHHLLNARGDDWTETTLGNVAEINSETAKNWGADEIVTYIDLSSVTFDSGVGVELFKGRFKDAPGRARRIVRTGDILVSTVRPYLRGFAVVPSRLDGALASTGFAVLRAKQGASISGFIWALIGMEEFVSHLMELATGSNYPAVRPSDVASTKLLLPPVKEQQRIVDEISKVDAVIQETTSALAATRQLRSALLNKEIS
jgi:type I restriction enzyme S subunit